MIADLKLCYASFANRRDLLLPLSSRWESASGSMSRCTVLFTPSWLSELPFPEANRLVAISETWTDGISPMSYPDYLTGRLRSIRSMRSRSHVVMTLT